MTTYFLEVVFNNEDWEFSGRDEVEDALDEALADAELGSVTGGGSGTTTVNIDVSATELDAGVALIREVLHELQAASSTYINYHPQGSEKARRYELEA